jgi:hypothetical protein
MDQHPAPLRFVVLHRGAPPATTPDPWAAGDEPRIAQLARAIATSDGWRGRASVLVVRSSPDPLIAAIGRFGDADEQWMTAASGQLATTLQRIVLLDDSAVNDAATLLAEKLVERFGAPTLKAFRYLAVPRGGLIVLGVLAYLLDVPRERVQNSRLSDADDDAPLVIVDDIAISGVRLSEAIASRPERRLVVATLHAHPDLRDAFGMAHTRVEAFVSAHDLHDHAPGALGDGYEAWRERWRERAVPGTLWIGQGDHVVYPWNEPDLSVWNPVTEREELGWRVVPPERCLKRRSTPSIPVQHMLLPRGRLRPHPDVVAGELDGQVVIGHLGSGQSFALDGVAADIWRALDGADDERTAVQHLACAYDVDAASLERDVEAFVVELVAAGVLVEAPS